MSRYSSTDILIVLGVAATFVIVYLLANGGGGSRPQVDDSNGAFALIPAGKALAAPDFTLQATNGSTVNLASALAKGPVVIDFWATWCGPCKMELPLIDNLNRTYQARGVQFYGINSDATADQINQFFGKQPLSFPMLLDTGGTVASAYDVDSIPRIVVIDRHGRARAVDDGFDPDTQHDLSSTLNSVLKEQ